MQISKFLLCLCALALCAGMAVHAEDTPAQAAARAAMMKQMQELQGGSASAPQTSAPAKSAPAATAKPPAAVAPAANKTSTAAPAQMPAASSTSNLPPAAPQPGDTAAQATARAALEAKMAELGTPYTPAPVVAAQGTMPTARSASTMGQPIVAPPLPISTAQEQKLQSLLSLYRANQISPQQYQEQRAAILAGKQ